MIITTATIYKKSNCKNWYCMLSWVDRGIRKQKSINTNISVKISKRTVKKTVGIIQRQFEEKLNSNIINLPNVLFSDFMVKWLEIVKISLKQSTYEGYKNIIEKHIFPYFSKGINKVYINNVNTDDLQKYYNSLELSPNTIRRHHANIHKALNYAIRQGYINKNVSDYVTLPQKEYLKTDYYTLIDIKKMLKVFEDDCLYPVVLLAVVYGLRRGEILGLKKRSVDFDSMFFKVEHTVTRVNSIICSDGAKNSSSIRSYPLLPFISDLLKIHFDNCDDDYLFNFTPDYVSKHFKNILELNNLKIIRFHDLRHSNVTLLLNLGVDLKNISSWVGHANISITADTYSHLEYTNKKQIASLLDDIFSDC